MSGWRRLRERALAYDFFIADTPIFCQLRKRDGSLINALDAMLEDFESEDYKKRGVLGTCSTSQLQYVTVNWAGKGTTQGQLATDKTVNASTTVTTTTHANQVTVAYSSTADPNVDLDPTTVPAETTPTVTGVSGGSVPPTAKQTLATGANTAATTATTAKAPCGKTMTGTLLYTDRCESLARRLISLLTRSSSVSRGVTHRQQQRR